MLTTIRLLGTPAILREGLAPPPLRGRKAWALLAYLLLCERPVTRQLAELLFSTAADPLGALRWNLAQLRRTLGTAVVLRGDPVQLVLAADVAIDVHDSISVDAMLWTGWSSRPVRPLTRGCWWHADATSVELRGFCVRPRWPSSPLAATIRRLSWPCAQMRSSRGWIDEARARCTRLPARYVWMQGHVRDTAILFRLEDGEHEETHTLIRTLSALAARTEMRELVVRGLVHAARIGPAGALDSARMLASEIDNPALTTLLAKDF